MWTATARATSIYQPEAEQESSRSGLSGAGIGHADQVFLNRLNWILGHYETSLRECALRIPFKEAITPATTALSIRKSIGSSIRSEAWADPVYQALALIAQAESYDSSGGGVCTPEIQAARKRIEHAERKKFAPFVKAIQATAPKEYKSIASKLDPHCSLPVAPNSQGYVDSNPCFAGDRLVFERIAPFILSHESFVSAFDRTVQGLADGSVLDLWRLYLAQERFANDWAFDERMKFLGFLAFGMSSATSSAGYVDGYAEQAWREKMPDVGEAYRNYHGYKRIKSQFSSTWNLALKKEIRIQVNGLDWDGVNRHEAMAAFLACELATDDVTLATHLLPRVLTQSMGVAYESKDLLSHLRDGVSLKNSLNGFQVDTSRYERGYRRGIHFCRFQREFPEEVS